MKSNIQRPGKRRLGPTASATQTVLIYAMVVMVGSFVPILAARLRGENGEISMAIAVPLTNEGKSKPEPGFAHMMAAILAVDHFNDRNPAVIEELAHPELVNCPFRLVNVTVIDTGSSGHMATKTLLKRIQNDGVVDSIAGPYDDLPALELSVLATGMEAPIVAFRGLDQSLVLPDVHPFFSQVYPDLNGEMEFVGKFLSYTNRTNYIAVLHSNEDAVLQRIEVLRKVLYQRNMDQIRTFGFQGVGKLQEGEDRGIVDAVRQIAKTGYRTILVILTNPDLDSFEIGRAVHEYKLDRGDHFWIMVGGLDPSSSLKTQLLADVRYSPEGQHLQGMAFLYIFDTHYIDANNSFQMSIRQQNMTFIEKLVNMTPVPNYFDGSSCEEDARHCELFGFTLRSLLQQPVLSERIEFAYDATMAIGIGACNALPKYRAMGGNTTTITGEQHLEGIQSTDFKGLTGRVRFKNLPGTPGSRDGSSVYYGVLNLNRRDANDSDLAEGTMFLDPFTQEWVEVVPFEYADGSNSPPKLLRTPPAQNYLNPVARAVGLSLMSIAIFTIFISLVWVFVNRGHRIVIAAQPPFLYLLCLGATLTSLVILTQSFDESYGWTVQMLDKACLALPWLASLGVMVTYCALFSKLWRVNKVLQFKRARIKIWQVVWPALGLFIAAVVILAVWTATTDFGWVREEIDELSGATIGRCKGTNTIAFLLPVIVIVLIPMVLAGVMAWKTSDVDDMYSEGKWIFALILVQLQVFVVGVPVIILLQDVSSTGRYIGLSLLVWTFPMGVMGLIMAPKMIKLRREKHGGGQRTKRGSSEGVRVTGLNSSTGQSTSREAQQRSSNSTAMASAPTSSLTNNADSTCAGGPSPMKSPRIQMVTME